MSTKSLPPGLDLLPSGKIRARFRCRGCATHPTSGFHSQTFPPRPTKPGAADGGSRVAQAWLRDERAKVDQGGYVAPRGSSVTFGQYAPERAAAWRRHRASTRAAVESHLRNHLLPTFGGVQVGAIRPAHVEAWVVATQATLAPATLGVVFAWLSRIMADAVREGLVRSNPCAGIELPTPERREVEPLPLDAVDALVEAMPDYAATIVLTAAWSGLRQGEVLGLRTQRLSLLGTRDERGRMLPPSLHVAEQLQTLDGPPRLVPPKTTRSVRRVPIPGVLVDGLAAHLAAFPAGDDGFVFTNSQGRPWRRNAFGAVWTRAVRDAGLPRGTRFHDLRHTYASLLIEAGESVTVVSRRLGHASPNETLATYSHLWPDSDERTVTVLDAAHARHAERVTGVSQRSPLTAL